MAFLKRFLFLKPQAIFLIFCILLFLACWFQGSEATPEEQRVKLITLAQKMKDHPDYKEKYADNSDDENREIAFKKIFDDVMGKQRRNELDLYRLISQDEVFKIAMQDTIKRILGVDTIGG